MEIQPQLVLLQKTLLQVEGLGRQLDPDLDLRRAAQPILERWMNEQVGARAFLKSMRAEAPMWARSLPQLPRLVHRALADGTPQRLEQALLRIEAAQRRQNRVLLVLVVAIVVLGIAFLLRGSV
jgi:ubiquinone biosynthesis protein